MTAPARLALFVDYQNVYRRARDAFGFEDAGDTFTAGQVNPYLLGRLIASRVERANGARLDRVTVYRGMPDGSRDPKGYGACRRQVAVWEALHPCVKVETRPLRYPDEYPTKAATEKGVDVKLALDFLDAALKGSADMLVLFSADTDLAPALEMVYERFDQLRVWAWSAAWKGAPRLSLRERLADGSHRPRRGFHCFNLSREDFERVRDDVNYLPEPKHVDGKDDA